VCCWFDIICAAGWDAACRAYKEEEKKLGTLTNENIERPDSMTTQGKAAASL
jgi:hypothetical protein